MAPVKVGKRVEDLKAAHEQDHQRQGIDPMGRPGNQVVAVLTGNHDNSLLAPIRFNFVEEIAHAEHQARPKSGFTM